MQVANPDKADIGGPLVERPQLLGAITLAALEEDLDGSAICSHRPVSKSGNMTTTASNNASL